MAFRYPFTRNRERLTMSNIKFVNNRDGGGYYLSLRKRVPNSYSVMYNGEEVGIAIERNMRWGFYPVGDAGGYNYTCRLANARTFNQLKSAIKLHFQTREVNHV